MLICKMEVNIITVNEQFLKKCLYLLCRKDLKQVRLLESKVDRNKHALKRTLFNETRPYNIQFVLEKYVSQVKDKTKCSTLVKPTLYYTA